MFYSEIPPLALEKPLLPDTSTLVVKDLENGAVQIGKVKFGDFGEAITWLVTSALKSLQKDKTIGTKLVHLHLMDPTLGSKAWPLRMEPRMAMASLLKWW